MQILCETTTRKSARICFEKKEQKSFSFFTPSKKKTRIIVNFFWLKTSERAKEREPKKC